MPLLVQKFGGSSLATPNHILRAAQRIAAVKASGQDLIVVVSAMGRMTDHLIRLARKTVENPPQREMDMLMTAGERVSMSLLAMALDQYGIPAISFTGSQSGILTSSDHTEARIVELRGERILRELERGRVVIVAGFQGVSREREITTLGRGGSDTTAIALAAALNAQRCEIFTDVDGLYSADPRLVPSARLIARCSYEEGLELAGLGAKMHSRSLEVAKRFGVVVRIASSSNHDCSGTIISDGKGNTPMEPAAMLPAIEQVAIRGIATKTGYQFFKASVGVEVFARLLGKARLAARLVSVGSGEMLFVVDEEKARAMSSALTQASIPFTVQAKVGLISAVGEGLSAPNDELSRFVAALEASSSPVLMLAANSLSITAVVAQENLERAAQSAHAALIETHPAR